MNFNIHCPILHSKVVDVREVLSKGETEDAIKVRELEWSSGQDGPVRVHFILSLPAKGLRQ